MWNTTLALPLVCVAITFLPVQDPNPEDPPVEEEAEELRFPRFEHVHASRMYGLVDGDGAASRSIAQNIATLEKNIADYEEAAEGERETGRRDVKPGSHPALLPEPSARIGKVWYWTLAQAIEPLAPLWEREQWSEDEVRLANLAGEYIGLLDGNPDFSFDEETPEANADELKELVRWYWEEAKRPEILAAMILTMDNGPYCGLALEDEAADLVEAGEHALFDGYELRLSRLEAEPRSWVLQGAAGDEVRWGRVFTNEYEHVFGDLSFAGGKSIPLGPHGYRVDMVADGELTHVYLDPEGELLFYFVSW